MRAQTLEFYMKSLDLNASDVAREVGVSRQAVSSWLHTAPEKDLNLQAKHLKALSKSLHVPAERLLNPPALLSNKPDIEKENALLNWDRLYPDLASLIVALLRNETVAIARLVQVNGIFESAKILGSIVWDEFQNYKRYIHPAVRKGLESLWQLQMTQICSQTM